MAIWIGCLAALALPVVLLLVLFTILHNRAVNSVYKNLDDISDREMPSTVTSFQSGPDVVSTIGGSGEGLNCSLPTWANVFFDRSKNKDNGKRHLVLQRFRQACIFHDLCYRHGLATYGYNQNDCDRVLQNASFRLCLYIRNGEAPDDTARCQTDSRLILAGVSVGGSEAYRAWDRSTYFEFESDPSRSNGFSVSRVVEHPFKLIHPEKYRDDPPQVILTFENVRSNLTVTCVTCKDVPILKKAGNHYDITPELRSVKIDKIPDALLKNPDRKLRDTTPVWLPPRRRHAAPHLLVDSAGKNHLIWMSRNNPGNSVACIVLADAAKLLTHTQPKADACSNKVDSPLGMIEVDMFATSPLPMEVPGRAPADNIFATAISPKRLSPELSFCWRPPSREVTQADDKAECTPFTFPGISNGEGLGAFQNFAVVRPGQQILFARDIAPPDASWWISYLQSFFGIKYSSNGYMFRLDVAETAPGTLVPEIGKVVKFDIDDRYDPMMPISQKRNDLQFLSLERTEAKVGVRMIDFANNDPKVGNVPLVMNDRDVSLHSSWALRPVLVLETKGSGAKSKLVFSRGEISPRSPASVASETVDERKFESESLQLEMLVFERDVDSPDKPFRKAEGATCKVTYEFQFPPSLRDFPCYHPFDPDRPMRASPAARMQASQLLVGQFAGRDGYGIAFSEFCLSAYPLILKAGDGTFTPLTEKIGDDADKTRAVTCEPLASNEYVGEPIYPDPNQIALVDRWPLP
jgi:hypothetical protein